MATNEELCARVQSGDQAALWELWEQNQGVTRIHAWKVLRALCGRGGVELEDLIQSGWFALLDAVKDYDPGSGWNFTTYYTNRLKTAFAEATGFRTERQKRDPLQSARSLDAPISEGEPDGDTFGSLIQDHRQDMEWVDERLHDDWQRGVLRSQLEGLPADQAQALRLRYWRGCTIRETAAAMGVPDAQARKLERKALDSLRRRREVRALRDYLDERTDFFRRGPDPVMDNVIWRDELTERWSGH